MPAKASVRSCCVHAVASAPAVALHMGGFSGAQLKVVLGYPHDPHQLLTAGESLNEGRI
jgi:hypothetical protein